MLFKYSHCRCCQNDMNEMKMTLHNILPVNICIKICEYNVYCKYCRLLVEDERKFSKLKQKEGVSKIELHIRFLTLFNKPVFEPKDLKHVKIQKMNTIIDNSDDDDIRFKKVMKSFFRMMYHWFNRHILPSIGDKDLFKDNTDIWRNSEFQYYNYYYRDQMLIKFIVYEYLLALIGNDIDYMELEDIHDYLDEVLPKERKDDDCYCTSEEE